MNLTLNDDWLLAAIVDKLIKKSSFPTSFLKKTEKKWLTVGTASGKKKTKKQTCYK